MHGEGCSKENLSRVFDGLWKSSNKLNNVRGVEDARGGEVSQSISIENCPR